MRLAIAALVALAASGAAAQTYREPPVLAEAVNSGSFRRSASACPSVPTSPSSIRSSRSAAMAARSA